MRDHPTDSSQGRAPGRSDPARPQVDEATAAWLRRHQQACNARLEAQRQRTPRAPAARILAGIADALPPWVAAIDTAASDTAASDALLFAIFDLIVLHASRDTLARPAVHHLLHALPRATGALRACLAAPRAVPASLSNAAERMADQGVAFLDAMFDLAPPATADAAAAAAWLRLGGIVAWRLGDPRFRGAALGEIAVAPARTLLDALGLGAWPESLAEVVRAGLGRDAWWDPNSLRQGTDANATPMALALRDPVTRIELQARVGRRRASAPLEQWEEVAQIGAYLGLGGAFARPPQVVAVASPHVLFIAVGSDTFRVDADRFGVRVVPSALADVPDLGDDVAVAAVAPDLQRAVERLQAAQKAAGATSLIAGPGVVAWTHGTSFRVRLLLPPLAALDLPGDGAVAAALRSADGTRP